MTNETLRRLHATPLPDSLDTSELSLQRRTSYIVCSVVVLLRQLTLL